MTGEERFQELYHKYHQLVLRVAYNRVQDYYEAQDICQDTFLKMIRRMDLSRPDTEIKYWLITVANNTAIDVMKKGGRYAGAMESLGNRPEGETSKKKTAGNDCFEEVLKKDLRTRILEQLREVNAEQYEIVWHVCCLQMSIGEAAKRLGLSYETATMRLHRARAWIRVNYGKEYEELKY